MTTRTYLVSGMTCSHCLSAVTEELEALDGLLGVSIELVPGGPSLVRVTSTLPLDVAAVRSAVDEAGYVLVEP